MLDDIRRQPDSLRQAWQHQLGPGLDDLLRAGRHISAAQRIIFTGMGASLFAAVPAVSYLHQHGIAAEWIETAELLHFQATTLNAGTAVVVISRSGESVESLKLLPLLSAAGATVVGATNVEYSTLFREAPLEVLFHGNNDRMVAVQSYTSTVAVLLLLAASIVDSSLPAWASQIDSVCGSLDLAIMAALISADRQVELFQSGRGIYCVGRGASLGSAHEAALLFHEACRMPAAALSIAQYRHGPVEVTDSDTRFVVFTSRGRTESLDHGFVEDMKRMNAGVMLCSSQDVIDPFAPVVEIVPVQAVVCALAQAKGIDPGDFRYATLVTASETGFRTSGLQTK